MSYIETEPELLIELNSSECDLCGCCVGVCPEDALELTSRELIIITFRCTNCAKCVWSCPLEALHFNKRGTL